MTELWKTNKETEGDNSGDRAFLFFFLSIKKILFVPSMMLFAIVSCSQTNTHAGFIKDGDEKTFTGLIGNELKIEIKLERTGNKLSGSYFYFKSGKRQIHLLGTIDGESGFNLKEIFKGKNIGVFRGKVLSSGGIEGEWSTLDMKKVLPFTLIDKVLIQNNIEQLKATQHCPGCYLVYANLDQINLRDRDLRKAELKKARLRKADLRKTNFERADLTEADLTEADLKDANLTDANLTDAILCHTKMPDGKRVYSNCNGANLSGADLSSENLAGADLKKADLSGANLEEANLTKADLSGANLWKANFKEADLRKANLGRADLSQANLEEVDLSQANLEDAILCHTIMPDGKRVYSNCKEANLRGADLRNADLIGVNLAGAKMAGAKMSGVKLDGAILCHTIMPDVKENNSGCEK